MPQSESIKVAFRVRPLNQKEKQNGCRVATFAHVDSSHSTMCSANNPRKSKCTTPFAPQSYNLALRDNGTVFCFGQTGAGKTHTMEGAKEPKEMQGVMPRAFSHVFDSVALGEAPGSDESPDKFLIRASYIEIYNEEVMDLLSGKRQGLDLKESTEGVYVKGLTEVEVKSVEDMNAVLHKGAKNRSVGATAMNAGSSRSHSIFTIVVECCPTNSDGSEHIRVGKLRLVDLAGSERQAKTGATGQRLKEATKINLSLSALGNVISALVDGKSNHIPYRDSKLTRILQDSLGGNTKTVMIANAGPADYNFDESLSTLRYANRAKRIQNKPIVNEDAKDTMLREYQEEISRLKEQLALLPRSNEAESPDVAPARIDKYAVEQVSKESQDDIANTEAKMQELRQSNDQNSKELQQKLDDTESHRIQLEHQLREIKTKFLIGGEAANIAAKQEAALRKAEQELALKQEQELLLTRRMVEQEEEKLTLEDQYSSLAEEVEKKTNKLRRVWSKYQQAKQEIKDLEQENFDEKQLLLESVRDLSRQLKLKQHVISAFIPPAYAILFDDAEDGGRAVWDDSREAWTIPSLTFEVDGPGGRHLTKTSTTRPETKYSQQKQKSDPTNPRWFNQDVVALDVIMPTKSTCDVEDPNTIRKISAILSSDISDRALLRRARRRRSNDEKYFSTTSSKTKSKLKSLKENKKDRKGRKSKAPASAAS
ncbi:hypothetical protein THAOC_01574 [Thalassiosira oceanica]|uniref:Kinesin-like protein n=1 Tax=Thalassiosira oceanica TaxID=159749 RepID=K0TI26_THAOC|nr:hypothetical protein THAOC_01574 [Thalassiosira oceanica]|eukprot:EJK76654.1 hypothetical protein THAOC_01574 [Thalassiosira oceanica]